MTALGIASMGLDRLRSLKKQREEATPIPTTSSAEVRNAEGKVLESYPTGFRIFCILVLQLRER